MRKKLYLVSFVLAGLMLFTLGCKGGMEDSARLDLPPVHDTELIGRYVQLSETGYQALEEGNTEAALAAFTEQVHLIPNGRWGHYNLACANSRIGNTDAAFAYLDSAAAGGWSAVSHLEEDPDLAPLREDARFTSVLEKVRALDAEKMQMLAAGLPHYKKLPQEFADSSALAAWLREEQQVLGMNSRVWHPWQVAAANLDLEAKRLAAQETLLGDEFDYDLERIITLGRINSPYEEKWGPICATMIEEIDSYLATNPKIESASEACYRGVVACVMEHGPDATATAEGQAALTRAEAYYSRMDPSYRRYAGAEGWLLAARLGGAGETRENLYAQVRDYVTRNAADENATQVARTRFAADMVKASWPIPLAATDIDGKPVALNDYRGKVLLVDFWATWCGPCRGELPYLKAVYEKYQKQGFEILSISLDYPNQTTQDAYRAWIAEAGMPWRHVYDEQNWLGPLPQSFAVASIPSAFLIGKDGSLIGMHDDCRGEALEPLVQKALTTQL